MGSRGRQGRQRDTVADDVNPQLITMEEAAVILGKSVRTIARLIETGKLPARKVLGRTMVLRTDVEALR